MFNWKRLHRDESGQTALEAAIILIAFIVVASVFAFAVLSSGSKSTEKGQKAINAGLEGVQSSMEVKGAVIAKESATPGTVGEVKITLALVAGGEPINMDPDDRKVVIGYRDSEQVVNALEWTIEDDGWLVVNGDADNLLEDGELLEVTVPLASPIALEANTQFTLEIKPPTGSIISLSRTTPAALEAVMELN